jgi:hypothetical protein
MIRSFGSDDGQIPVALVPVQIQVCVETVEGFVNW